jgi:pyrimidine-nucleoside phosphorylase/thymidine phosphorylase
VNNPAEPAGQAGFRAIDVIRKKRDGHELSRAEIDFLVRGYTAGQIPDYQISAWLMAALLKGLTRAETAALTDAMLHSGEVLDLSEFPAAKIDKHSTGGVGDKTSLVLAPLVAAAGLYVPMISGRGLGHTGGTLDKLESIPGFNVKVSLKKFREILRSCGCAMIGQTAEIAPADRLFYSLRDVTGTVESPFLICASIMSKKLAEGIDGLVLDVKTGSGAFMKTDEDAAFLAELMVETGQRMGKKVVALLTDMDQPLGLRVGNALEVEEVIEVLNGAGPEDLRELCVELAAWMIHLGVRAGTIGDAKKLAAETIRCGQALKKFRELVKLQGGDVACVDDPSKLPRAKSSLDVTSLASGYVAAIQSEDVGTACVILGGGREKKEDSVDPAAGIILHKKVGDRIAAGEKLCTLMYNSETRVARAKTLMQQSYRIDDSVPTPRKMIRRIISATE